MASLPRPARAVLVRFTGSAGPPRGVGTRSLNIELPALNRSGENKVERIGRTFAPGDKVMQIDNGDVSYVDVSISARVSWSR